MRERWDDLLLEDTAHQPDRRRPRRRRGFRVNWKLLALPLLTIAVVGAGMWWSATREDSTPSPSTSPTPSAVLATVSTPTTTATTAQTEPWSYDTTVATTVNEGAETVIAQVATVLLTDRYDEGELIDWWSIDERLATITSDMLRYEFVEYPHTQTAGLQSAETITAITYSPDPSAVGQWTGTITITLTRPTGSRTLTANVSAHAVPSGWNVTAWKVTP